MERSQLDKAFDILAVVARSPRGFTLSEVSTQTQISKTTAHRTTAALERLGALQRVGQRFILGPAMQQRHESVRGVDAGLVDVLTPALVDLHIRTHSTVLLWTLDGRDAVCMDKVWSARTARSQTRVGSREAAATIPGGRAILAYSAASVIAANKAGTPSRSPSSNRKEVPLDVELEAVRRSGVSHTDQNPSAPLRRIAAPIRSIGGAAVLSIELLHGHAPAHDPRRAAQLLDTCRAAERMLASYIAAQRAILQPAGA